MKVALLQNGMLAVSDASKQKAALAALDGATWEPMLKSWLVEATGANVTALASMCPSMPSEVTHLLPAATEHVIRDEGEWLTYDPSLYDPALVWVDDEGEKHDDNRDRAKEPWEHQRDAVGTMLDLFARGRGGALLMEQRTGKARISIELFARLAKMDLVTRVLVVSITTPCGDYCEQVAEYLDGAATVIPLFGLTPAKRKKRLDEARGSLMVAVINYESAWRFADELIEWAPDFVIADEMHKIKSHKSKAAKGMHRIGDAVRFRLGMTGTATPHDPLDLFSEYRFADKRVFGLDYYVTKAVYAVEGTIRGKGGKDKTYTRTLKDGTVIEKPIKTVIGYKRLDEFQAKMHSIAFVRRMEECHDLPPVAHKIVHVELGPKAKAAYRELERESIIAWESGETSAPNVLARKLRLQQITSGIVPRDDGGIEVVGDEKTRAMLDLADGLLDARKKFIVYARFTHEVEGAFELLDNLKASPAEISGRISIGPKRDAQIERFKTDPDCLALVCQIQAGGVGIDLSVASTEIFVSKTFDFVSYDQSRARIVHGSKRNLLTYYHLVAPGTVDEEIEESRALKCDLSLLLLRRRGNPYKAARV